MRVVVWGLTLPDGLEAEYDRRQNDRLRRQIIVVLGMIFVLSFLGLGADANAGVIDEALAAKLLIQFPLLVAGMAVAVRTGSSTLWLGLAASIPISATVGIVAALGTQTEPLLASRFLTIAGLVAVCTNVALPVKFANAFCFTLLNIGLLIAVPFALAPHDSVVSYLDVLLFMSAVALVSTAVAYTHERSQKDTFLMTLRNERQTLEYQALVDELTELAHRDPLTNVGNRRSFDIRFRALWQTAIVRREHVTLILVDIDHFKALNDAAGHREGDRCLKAVAKAIARGAACPLDHVARYGGEEFALILQSGTGRTAESIRASVEALALPHPGLPPGSVVTVSVGKASAFPTAEQGTPDDLVEAADQALYEAKASGRNRVVISERMQRAA